MRVLIAIPVYNEAKYADAVLRRVLAVRDSLAERYDVDVLAIDDDRSRGRPFDRGHQFQQGAFARAGMPGDVSSACSIARKNGLLRNSSTSE